MSELTTTETVVTLNTTEDVTTIATTETPVLLSVTDFAVGSISDLVPYSGASQDVNLGTNSLTTESTFFNTVPTVTPTQGQLYWDATDKTLAVDLDTANDVTLQVGQEFHVRAVNKTGSTITDGQVVYIDDAQGNRPTIALAIANDITKCRVIGVATQDIADNAEGYVTTFGKVHGFNTTGMTDGATLYLSASVAGALTETVPTSPNFVVTVATALNSTNNGSIFVHAHSPIAADTSLTANSDLVAPTQKAVKSYVDASAGSGVWTRASTTLSPTTAGDSVNVGTGNLTVDTSTLFVNSSSDRVGLGTASPDNRLHVFNGSADTVSSVGNSLLTLENSTHAYQNFLVPDGSAAGFAIGQGTNNADTYFTFNRVAADTWDITRTAVGSAFGYSVRNTDNTNGSSSAFAEALTTGASGGDPYFLCTVNGVTNWSMGIDNSDSDKFKIAPSANPSSGSLGISITTAGVTSVLATTDSTSISTGALTVAGGVGIAKNLYVGTDANTVSFLFASGSAYGHTFSYSSSALYLMQDTGGRKIYFSTNRANLDSVTTTEPAIAIQDGSYVLIRSNQGTTTSGIVLRTGSAGSVSIPNTTASTSSATGALVVSGGMGVAGNIFAGGDSYSFGAALPIIVLQSSTTTSPYGFNWKSGSAVDATITHQANTASLVISSGRSAAWGGDINFVIDTASAMTLDSTKLGVLATTASTSSTTGALTVAGGLGVAGGVFTGTTLSVGTTQVGRAFNLSAASAPAIGVFLSSTERLTIGVASSTNQFFTGAVTGDAIIRTTDTKALLLGITSGKLGIAIDGTNAYVGLGTVSPTHTLTLPSTSTGIALYNTADQTTNYERLEAIWSGSTAIIRTVQGGSGSIRTLQLLSGSRGFTIRGASSPIIEAISGNTTLTSGILAITSGGVNLNGTSATQIGVSISPTVTQSSTAGYTMLLVNPTESTTGSGTKLLADFQVGGASKFKIDNAGKVTSTATAINIATQTPASASATGTQGDIAWDSSYIYVCTATNTWKRAAIATW